MVSEPRTETEAPKAAVDMELEEPQSDAPSAPAEDASAISANGDSNSKRERDGDEQEAEESVDGGVAKKQKVDKSVEEERLEKLEEGEGGGEGEVLEEEKSGPVIIGPKTFESSRDMFDYFFKFLFHWSTNLDVNKYEHMVLLDLIKKGHSDPEKKIGDGVKAFQIRYHPEYKSRCFFVIRTDESVDDFSFRKCVDNILPLPENMKARNEVNKVLGGGGGGRRGGGGGRGSGRGRGRGWGGYSRR